MRRAKKKSYRASDKDRAKRAIEWLLSHEGGYVNHPDDPGGETNFGITKRSYPDVNIKALTKAEAAAIYERDFWNPYGYSEIESDKVAFKVFDISVNTGSYRAQRMLQIALRKDLGFYDLATDGVLGPITAARTNEAVEKYGEDAVLNFFSNRMETFYRSLGKPVFIKGWLNRLYDEYAGTAEVSDLEDDLPEETTEEGGEES